MRRVLPHPTLHIDQTLPTVSQLTASDVNFALVRPLVFKYSRLKNPAVVYAVLIVRSHFLSLASEDLAYSGVMISRANLCEIMAMKLLVPFASTEVGTAMVLTTSWSPLTGAPPNVVSEIRSHMGGEEDDLHDPQSALEMAIAGSAKTFMSAPLVQTVVHHIYTGRLVLSMVAHRSMLADNYKPRPLEIYDPGRAPFLDHYRYVPWLTLLSWYMTSPQASSAAIWAHFR